MLRCEQCVMQDCGNCVSIPQDNCGNCTQSPDAFACSPAPAVYNNKDVWWREVQPNRKNISSGEDASLGTVAASVTSYMEELTA